EALLAGRVVDGPRPERQTHGHDGLVVVFDHDEGEPIRKRRLFERREVNGRESRGLGRSRRECLAGQPDGRTAGQENPGGHRDDRPPIRPSARPPAHCATPLAAGFTMITSAFAGSRYLAATRRMSSAVTARKRSRSLLISARDAWNMS